MGKSLFALLLKLEAIEFSSSILYLRSTRSSLSGASKELHVVTKETKEIDNINLHVICLPTFCTNEKFAQSETQLTPFTHYLQTKLRRKKGDFNWSFKQIRFHLSFRIWRLKCSKVCQMEVYLEKIMINSPHV